MGTVDDYLAGLDDTDRTVIGHVYDVAVTTEPDAEQGVGYGMPALVLTDKHKPLLSVMRARSHIGVYPFSPAAVRAVADEVDAFPGTSRDKGTIRFQPQNPLPDDVITHLVRTRAAEIRG